MAEWRTRAEITADVVFFKYASDQLESDAEELFIWDLDKTYLDTRFETLKGLYHTILEKAFQKRNVPGTGALVRALRNSWQESHLGRVDFPIYFITASPPQMEKKIHEKLNLDGIYPYGIFFKDNLKNLAPKRFWRLTHQIGFKLQALLQLRLHLGENVRQVLWGDDSESDAVIYNLYSDICARRHSERETRDILKSFRVVGNQMETILRIQNELPENDPVEKIYINLASDTDPEYYTKFGRRTLPSYNTFQTALDLFQDGRLTKEQVGRVAHDMRENFSYTRDELEKSLDDLARRAIIGKETVEDIMPFLKEQNLIYTDFELTCEPKPISSKVGKRVYELEGTYDPWVPDTVDYLHDYR
ncbi:MAG: hypothetical protein HRT45_18165 [Bdellovibrionales bacterium]|nr:hypothetical protein [Bdellovibrionales bacterium]